MCRTCRASLDLTIEQTHTDIAKWMMCKCPVCHQSTPVHAAGKIVRVAERERVRQRRTAS